MENMQNLLELIDKNALSEDCDNLQKIPETGFELNKTLKYVTDTLRGLGIEYSSCGKCGVTAVIGDETLPETILLRADMDALPTEDGASHLCGHHMHTAMLLGAARTLKNPKCKLKRRVKLMFQPAEEILAGAKNMIDSGVLNSPEPDCAFMLHVTTGTDFDTGTFVFASSGDVAPAADYFDIAVEGVASHGAEPNLGRDALNAAAHIVCALQSINARELPLCEQGVITIGTIEGGSAPNAIAQKVKMSGTMRMYTNESREFAKKRITEIASSVASAMRTKATVEFTSGCPPFKNDKGILDTAVSVSKELFGKDKVVELPIGQKGGGSEDFAYISQEIPTAMALLCAGKKGEGYEYPLHHPMVKFDKKALPYGSALLVAISCQ